MKSGKLFALSPFIRKELGWIVMLQEYAQKAVDKYNAESNDLFKWELDSVDSVNKQIVTGIKVDMEFTMVQTDCTKQASQLTRTDCKKSNTLKADKWAIP